MSKFIHKRHNVSVLLYHIVCPAKYRRVVFTANVDEKLKETCLEISKRFEITFLEIGTDQDHVHFLVQSVPMLSPKRIVQIIKSITAREILRACPEVRKQLWGGQFWSNGYFVSTVGQHGNETSIRKYNQFFPQQAATFEKQSRQLFRSKLRGMYPLRFKIKVQNTFNCTRNNSSCFDTPQLAAVKFINQRHALGPHPWRAWRARLNGYI